MRRLQKSIEREKSARTWELQVLKKSIFELRSVAKQQLLSRSQDSTAQEPCTGVQPKQGTNY